MALNQRRISFGIHSDHKKRRPNLSGFQQIQQVRRVFGVWAIVEGQRQARSLIGGLSSTARQEPTRRHT
jgi:hypothetical protein